VNNNESARVTDEFVADVRREADACDPSIYRRLLGLPVRGRTGARIDRVLAARGFVPPGTGAAIANASNDEAS